jgi:hypothetical protein
MVNTEVARKRIDEWRLYQPPPVEHFQQDCMVHALLWDIAMNDCPATDSVDGIFRFQRRLWDMDLYGSSYNSMQSELREMDHVSHGVPLYLYTPGAPV